MPQPLINPVSITAVSAAAVLAALNWRRTGTRKGAAVGALVGLGAVYGYTGIFASGRYLAFTKVQAGSKGLAAKTVQKRLNMHGYGPLAEDGFVGDGTVDAIRRFQKARSLPETGVVDLSTWFYLTNRPSRASGGFSMSQILSTMRRRGYGIFTDGKWNIVGVRSNVANTNTFNDELHLFRKKGLLWEHYVYPITTDPGTHYLLTPKSGSATYSIAEGQYPNSHSFGLHGGKYEALVQTGTMRAYKDTDNDGQADYDPNAIITASYGMNIHKAGVSSNSVDKWSAGCQVFARERDFTEFMNLLKQSGQSSFTYTLLRESELPAFTIV